MFLCNIYDGIVDYQIWCSLVWVYRYFLELEFDGDRYICFLQFEDMVGHGLRLGVSCG